MCRIFNFYINSYQANDGSTNNNAFYFIDWSATIPRGKYKCSFTYNSFTYNNILLDENGHNNIGGILTNRLTHSQIKKQLNI